MSESGSGRGWTAPVRGGLWALFLPRSYYEDFPAAGRGGVSALGPYNGHPLADVGAMSLALGALLALAANSLGRELVRASLLAWLVFAVPHLVYHAATLHRYDPFVDRAGNVAGRGFPLALLYLEGSRWRAARQTGGARGG